MNLNNYKIPDGLRVQTYDLKSIYSNGVNFKNQLNKNKDVTKIFNNQFGGNYQHEPCETVFYVFDYKYSKEPELEKLEQDELEELEPELDKLEPELEKLEQDELEELEQDELEELEELKELEEPIKPTKQIRSLKGLFSQNIPDNESIGSLQSILRELKKSN